MSSISYSVENSKRKFRIKGTKSIKKINICMWGYAIIYEMVLHAFFGTLNWGNHCCKIKHLSEWLSLSF